MTWQRRGGCGRPRFTMFTLAALALVALPALAQGGDTAAVLRVLAGYLPFAGVGFLFGGLSYLARIARRNGTPIDPRSLIIRSAIGTGAGLIGLWILDATGVAALPALRLAVTASAALAGERIFRAAAAAAERRLSTAPPGGDT